MPVAVGRLPEQPRRRVPRTIVAAEQPAPVRNLPQRDESRPAERTGKVRDHRIRRDDEIEIGDHGGCIAERLVADVGCVQRRFDPCPERRAGELLSARSFLQ